MTVWTPDTDPEARIRLARGQFEVWFEDGRTDPAVVGFATLQEANDFITKDARAIGRPHRIETTGVDAGEPLEFVSGRESKVHATVQDVHTENSHKNVVLAEIERIAPGTEVLWSHDEDRNLKVELPTATPEVKEQISTEIGESAAIGSELQSKVRIV